MLRSLVNETINIDAFTTLRENGHFLSKKSQNAHKLNSTQNIKKRNGRRREKCGSLNYGMSKKTSFYYYKLFFY